MNRRVSVWKYVRIGKKWRYGKPAVGKNGKITSDYVVIEPDSNSPNNPT